MRKKSAFKTTPEQKLKGEFVKRVQGLVCTVYGIPTVAEFKVKKRRYAPAKRTVARILKKAGCTRSQIAQATGLSVYGVSATLEAASAASESKGLSETERKNYLAVVDKLNSASDVVSLGPVSPYDKRRKNRKSAASVPLPPLQRIEVLDKNPDASLPASQGIPTSFVEPSEKQDPETTRIPWPPKTLSSKIALAVMDSEIMLGTLFYKHLEKSAELARHAGIFLLWEARRKEKTEKNASHEVATELEISLKEVCEAVGHIKIELEEGGSWLGNVLDDIRTVLKHSR